MGTRRRDEGPDHRVFLASAVCGDLSENCWLLSLQLNGWYSGERAHSLPDSAHGAAFLRGGWLPGTRLPCHNSPLLPSAGAQSCGPAGRPGVALRPGGGPGEPAGCELVRVLPDCVAESAGPGLGLEAGRRLARRHRRTTVAGTTAGSPSQSHSAGPRLGGRES